jgi:hypothetical protein
VVLPIKLRPSITLKYTVLPSQHEVNIAETNVTDGVTVGVWVSVGVLVGVWVSVGVMVCVLVGVTVLVGVLVGVFVVVFVGV